MRGNRGRSGAAGEIDLSEETDRVLPCSCFAREKKEEAPLDERLPRVRA